MKTPEQKECEARHKARGDWTAEGEYRNTYPSGSLERVAYSEEFGKIANIFGEIGSMYEH